MAAKFRSTPPRRRRLEIAGIPFEKFVVSIHASAKEATYIFPSPRTECSVSIHASAKEAT